ncbi:hypothetical protein KSP39_PZI010284 [Platanthera zijinensis]|uniref:Uncharacterized protein n=1 Tax=Platanthera zijinensis TaxID=2320716 RepID=A0AAP0G7D4_9ASPA
MEAGKNAVVSSSPSTETCLSEVRIESSPTAIGFSDSCPCCGNRKRRSLLPASSYRKKLLVLHGSANPDPITSFSPAAGSPSPTPPLPSRPFLCSDPISPMSPPPPPTTPILHKPPFPEDSPAVTPTETLERSNSTLTEEKGMICTGKEEKKARLKNAEEEASPEEVRVCFRCRCGVVRRIRLVQ